MMKYINICRCFGSLVRSGLVWSGSGNMVCTTVHSTCTCTQYYKWPQDGCCGGGMPCGSLRKSMRTRMSMRIGITVHVFTYLGRRYDEFVLHVLRTWMRVGSEPVVLGMASWECQERWGEVSYMYGRSSDGGVEVLRSRCTPTNR